MGLQLRRRQGRGPGRDAQPARRQGRQPGRDGESRPAGAARLHHHHRGLHLFLRQRRDLSGRARRPRSRPRSPRSRRRSARKFGDADKPLLVSVRSGARASMPGMMDTVLNLGLNDETVEGLAESSRRRALRLRQLSPLHPDVRRRRARRRAPPVRGDPRASTRTTAASTLDTELDAEDWQTLVAGLQGAWSQDELGKPFPQDPKEQLWGAIGAVFGSLDERRAPSPTAGCTTSPSDWGTAVNVQAMVFGNMGEDCATGVAFTRDPSTGEQRVLRRVPGQRAGRGCGRRHPHAAAPDRSPARRPTARQLPAMEEAMPEVYAELATVRRPARRRTTATCRTSSSRSSAASSACCRPAPASAPPQAALKIAVDMVERRADRPATRRSAASSPPRSTSCCTRRSIPRRRRTVLGARPAGLARARPSGEVVFTADEAEARAAEGETVILVRIETSPEDIHGMHAAAGHPDRRAAA